MPKSLSFGKSQASDLITLVVLIALGAIYFFAYLPTSEKAVQERRFRCLRKIDANIRTKIDNSFEQVANLVDGYTRYSETDLVGKNLRAGIKDSLIRSNSVKDSSLVELRSFIAEYPKDNFTYLLPEQARQYFRNGNFIRLVFIGEDSTNTIKFYIDVGPYLTLLANKVKGNKSGGRKQDTLKSKVDTSLVSETTIGIRFEFSQFIKPLLPSDVFDNYIVFVKDKKYYESFASGLNYSPKDADSLMAVKSKITTPGIRSLNVGGTDYKLFSQPIYAYTDNRWIVTGLLEDSNYQNEKNQLPLWVLLLLLTSVIAMLVSLPWIKLYHMGNKDRLTVNDGIASVLVAMLLMSLLFFVMFKYRFSFKEEQLSYSYSDHKKLENVSYPMHAYSRNVLASKITNAFTNEINTADTLLNSFDKIHVKTDTDVYLLGKGKERELIRYDTLFNESGKMAEMTRKKTNAEIRIDRKYNAAEKDTTIVIKTATSGKDDTLFTKYDILFKKNSRGIDVKQVFWLDNFGAEKTNLTIDSNNDPKSNYNERGYFRNALSKSYNKTGRNPFYIDQVVSRTEGIFRSVISKSNPKDSTVIAMSFVVKSLDSVIMPDGYQFAIIDNYGRVLYHSKPNRNLNENLKDELTDSASLVSCIEARSDTCFKAEYYGKQYNVKIKPIPNLPYFTIVFEDLEYNDARDTEAYTFTLSMLICMLVFVSLKYGVVFFASSRRSYFKKQHFDTSWIGPHIKSHHEYNLATFANLFMILLLVIFFNWSSFLEYLYILLISVVFTSLFLNVIFASKYRDPHAASYKAIFKIIGKYVDADPDSYKYNFKETAIYWLIGFIVIIDMSACLKLGFTHICFLFVYELILIAVFPVLLFSAKFLLKQARDYKQIRAFPWTFTHSFALMAVTRLIISSGIPVAFFFIYSNNYEQNLDTRYRQINFAKALSQKVDLTGKDTAVINGKLNNIKNNQVYTSGIYFDGLFIDSLKVDTGNNITGKLKLMSRYTKEDSFTAGILSAFRLHVNHIEVTNNNLDLPSADSIAFFNKLNRPCYDGSAVKTFYKINANRYLDISSLPRIGYRQPQLVYFWILLLALAFVFYHIIHQITKKLFALTLHPVDDWRPIDGELLNDKANGRILIVGSPGSDMLSKLQDKIRNGEIESTDSAPLLLDDKGTSKKNVFIVDMMKISAENGEFDKDWKNHIEQAFNGCALVIVNHFEYNIYDGRVNKVKLELLESLIEQNIAKVIIVSAMHPLIFLDSFNQKQSDKIQESEIIRWHMLLGSFYVLIDHLSSFDTHQGIEMPEKAIIAETKYSDFLSRMQKMSLQSLRREIKSKPPEEETIGQITDSMIFKLQLTSQYFYMDLWQSLTREEKFILYDLAEDGLVNSYDDFNLSMLICKGVIIKHDGVLMVFNRSFRNFILTAIGSKEINQIKEQVRDNGKWGNLKMPLNIAILAILVFLFASQQEAYSRVITYITAFGAAIPTTLKIFSMFGSGSAQKTD